MVVRRPRGRRAGLDFTIVDAHPNTGDSWRQRWDSLGLGSALISGVAGESMRCCGTCSCRVAVAVTGEGAANQGAFHESLNLASLWKLPVVFVVEDNDWGISVPRSASTCVTSNAVRAAGYDMPGERVEDNSVEAVHAAAERAVARARAGEGPSLIEVHTLRLWGHFEGDAQGYRPDLEGVPGRDPLPTYEAELRRAGVLGDAGAREAADAAAQRVEDAIAFAKQSAEPAPETARDYVFA
ncbi:thiamine pyrophosphate-dependent enzyme [Amycolatopsis thermoflava]|uniref:thiamine pyrophosphate-dependent enzyme n=1 Tax=Amycolatopsis thermoflava TaxID=84480 RepID=UPI003655F11D